MRKALKAIPFGKKTWIIALSRPRTLFSQITLPSVYKFSFDCSHMDLTCSTHIIIHNGSTVEKYTGIVREQLFVNAGAIILNIGAFIDQVIPID
jgi:hypothetical protein